MSPRIAPRTTSAMHPQTTNGAYRPYSKAMRRLYTVGVRAQTKTQPDFSGGVRPAYASTVAMTRSYNSSTRRLDFRQEVRRKALQDPTGALQEHITVFHPADRHDLDSHLNLVRLDLAAIDVAQGGL